MMHPAGTSRRSGDRSNTNMSREPNSKSTVSRFVYCFFRLALNDSPICPDTMFAPYFARCLRTALGSSPFVISLPNFSATSWGYISEYESSSSPALFAVSGVKVFIFGNSSVLDIGSGEADSDSAVSVL